MNRNAALLAAVSLALPLAAQEAYRLPPPAVVELVDAPPSPSISTSPDGAWMLVVEQDALPTIADLSRPMLRLAGTRIDPAANARYSTSFDAGLLLRDLAGERETRVPLPEGARLARTSWSHTSEHFAFTVVSKGGTELWVASVAKPAEPKLVTDRVNAVLTGGFEWMPGNVVTLGPALLAVSVVPDGRGEPPLEARVPSGPTVQETAGDTSPLRTYQDLLGGPHDATLFEHYATSQLMIVEYRPGEAIHLVKLRIGPASMITGFAPSPNGEHLLVTRLAKPFSYLMPYYMFPHTIEVWSAKGEREHVVANVPLEENVPIDGVRTGPRSVAWRAGRPATLAWAEALDGGDPERVVPHRDRVLEQSFPFESEPSEIARTEHRFRGVSWIEGSPLFFVSEYDRDRRWTRTWLAGGPGELLLVEDRSVRDRYGDPGSVVLALDDTGYAVVRTDGGWIYRTGRGSSPEGDRPFLDRQSLETLATERLWRCADGVYESVADLLPAETTADLRFVTRFESPIEPPNYRLRSIAEPQDVVALTDYPDPTPALRKVTKQLVKYERADGVPLSATLYLPEGYEEGTRLPLVVWAYPLEYNDPATAGQVSGSPHRFTRVGGASHLYFLTQGYAVMDAATMPVIGDPETMNDTFIEQIVAAAQAAIDHAVELGVADRTRVGVGGHSYGAFMTANLLAHCDLFRAGIARSGAYNRTLTPFGFQSERRTVWEAPEVYFQLSPFMHADAIDEPLLLVHGEIDNNSGTFPVQSTRLFQAIKGNGGTARLVFLPNESHGYLARESVLHTLAEMIDWFDEHVKGAAPVEASATKE